MDILFEVKSLFDEHSDRAATGERFQEVFASQREKCLWTTEPPTLEMSEPGDAVDFWGSMRLGDSLGDISQLLHCLLTLSGAFPRAELQLKCDEAPGFVLDGKVELISDGKYQRYGRQLKAFCKDHALETVAWEFQVDPRIWMTVVGKHPDASENQILTTRLARAIAFSHNERLKGPFLGFPLDYPGLERHRKELRVPTELAAKAASTANRLDISRQELTERAIYAGLLR
jgi:hypothetical protein